jgi:hypothetical protein
MATPVFVCRRCRGGCELAARLDRYDELDVRVVGCQKICSHPVVGVRHDGTISWFRRVDSKALRKKLRAWIADPDDGRPPKQLRRLLVPARAGRIRD